jgi:hypothetical protein
VVLAGALLYRTEYVLQEECLVMRASLRIGRSELHDVAFSTKPSPCLGGRTDVTPEETLMKHETTLLCPKLTF